MNRLCQWGTEGLGLMGVKRRRGVVPRLRTLPGPRRMSCSIPHRHLWSPERLSAADLHALLDTADDVKRAKQRDREPST